MRLLACILTAFLGVHAAPILRSIDSAGSVGWDPSLQVFGTSLAVSYWDAANDDLKYATCQGDCLGGGGTWTVSTVDSASRVGMYSSLALNAAGNPVISYRDLGRGMLKLATCTSNCWSASRTWVIVDVDGTGGDSGLFTSLKLRDGNPVIAYRERTNGDLKLATCTAACASSAPSWTIVTVDAAGDTGRYATLQLSGDNLVISYFDVTTGRVKLATCTAGCTTASPTWVIAVVDGPLAAEDSRWSMQLDGDRPVISYFNGGSGGLKLATCVAACASASPSWVITRVETGTLGNFSSLQLTGGRPVIAYESYEAGLGGLRLAICESACASAAPVWSFMWLDRGNAFGSGWYSSLQLVAGTAIVSYFDADAEDLRLAVLPAATAAKAGNYQALWWGGASESGWGLNIAHQGDVLFATWFTYDTDGSGMWLLAPDMRKSDGATYSGALFRARGPSFDAMPFDYSRVALTQIGTATLQFADEEAGTFQYSVNGISGSKSITRLVFDPSRASRCTVGGTPGAAPNYQDLWIAPNAAEAGWGVNITHQGDILFATWFTYDADGKGQWFVMSRLDRQADGRYTGGIQRTTGPAFNAAPFNPSAVQQATVGTATFDFRTTPASFTYTVGSVTQTRQMQRFSFASPASVCR